MSRQTILTTAAAENGILENPPDSNKTKYGVWYGLNGVRWCAIFVSWVFDKAGHSLGTIDSPKGYHYCPSAYNFWRRNKMLTSDPLPGDIVLFDWNGDALSDHTGIFNAWITKGETFTAWEGNTSPTNNSNGGKVSLRTRSVGEVLAFVNPGVFGDKPAPHSDIISKGSKGASVTNIQKMLLDLNYSIAVDGSFGPATEKIVISFQQGSGLTVTGQVDEITLGALQAELVFKKEKVLASGSILKKGSLGSAVITLQKALNKKGAKPKLDEDGVFGNGTVTALKAFQKKNKIKPDGVAGPQVWAKINNE